MAFGTPTDGGAAYSAAAGTTVAPAYPAGIAANDVVVLVIGQKPSTANGGTVTTPTGWTLRESITGQGGYGATLGADTGNTNLFFYTKDVVAGTETGNLTVTIGTNNVSWGVLIRIPGGGSSSFTVGSADGSRATAPTSGVAFTTLLTDGLTHPDLQSGDMAIWAMCIPTDILNNGFTLPTISSTGTTFATAVELEEPDSGTGNDIGGYIAYALATAGSSTTAPTVGVTATGTVTNVRGPIALVRIRDTTQQLTPARYNNTNTFFSPTVAAGAVTLTPALFTNTNTFFSATVEASNAVTPDRFDNTNTFYAATVTQTAPVQTLTPDRYDNTNVFYSATVAAGAVTLTPARYDNTNVFYAATVTAGAVTLTPARYDNTNVFYSATVAASNVLTPARYDNTNVFYAATVAGGVVTLEPELYTNTNVFYSATVAASYTLTPARYDNTNVFYSATVTASNTLTPALYTNTNVFYSATVAQTGGLQTLTPARYDNPNVFYAATVAAGAVTIAPARYDNTNTFYAATITASNTLAPARYDNINAFYTPTVAQAQTLAPALYTNTNTFFPASTTYTISLGPYVDDGYVDAGYIGLSLQNINTFYSATVSPGAVTLLPDRYDNQNEIFDANALAVNPVTPARYDNTNVFYSAVIVQTDRQIAPPLVVNVNIFFGPYLISFPPADFKPPWAREPMPPIEEQPRGALQVTETARTPLVITQNPRQPFQESSTPRQPFNFSA